MTKTLTLRFVLYFLIVALHFDGILHAQTEEDREAFRRKASFNFMMLESMKAAGYDTQWSKALEILPSQQALVKEIIKDYEIKQQQWMESRDAAIKEILIDDRLTEVEKRKKSDTIEYQQIQKFAELIDESMQKFETVLLPHQYLGLRQMAAQEQLMSLMRMSGIKGFESVCDFLVLDDDEKLAVEKTLQEVQKEYEEELAKLRKEFEKKTNETLPIKSRKKLNEFFGEWYYFGR